MVNTDGFYFVARDSLMCFVLGVLCIGFAGCAFGFVVCVGVVGVGVSVGVCWCFGIGVLPFLL